LLLVFYPFVGHFFRTMNQSIALVSSAGSSTRSLAVRQSGKVRSLGLDAWLCLGIAATAFVPVPPALSGAIASALEATASPAAAGHQKSSLVEPPFDIGCQYARYIAAYLRDYLDAGCGNGYLQWPGYCPANQHVGTGFHQLGCACLGGLDVEDHILSRLLDAAVDFDYQHVAGYVEHRTDPALPLRYRDLYHVKAYFKYRASDEFSKTSRFLGGYYAVDIGLFAAIRAKR